MCFRILLSFLGFVLLAPALSSAQVRNREFSPEALRHIGLEKMWQTQVAVDSSHGSVVGVTPDVSGENAFTVFEVEHEFGPTVFTDRQLDAFGLPLGLEGADREARETKERLEQRGQMATIKEFTVPQVSLYAQTSEGVLHAIDAETGRTRWKMAAGRREYPSLEPAIRGQYVAVVNGATIHVMDVVNGKLMWERSLFAAPGAPPAMSDSHVFVPMSNGMLETFELEDSPRAPSRTAVGGYATGRPTVTPQTVSWGTDRGYLYVRDVASPQLRFRLETSDAIVGHSLFYPPDHLIAVSRDGYVYCVNEHRGTLKWRFSTGEPVSHQAVLVGDGVYVVTDHGGMYRISATTGLEQWRAGHITRFVSSAGERLYCLGDAHRLVVLDANSGGRIASMPLPSSDLVISQGLTDRLYLGTSNGQIVCLREPQNRWPISHRRWDEGSMPADESSDSEQDDADAGVFEPDEFDGQGSAPADERGMPDPADAMDEDPFGEDPFQ